VARGLEQLPKVFSRPVWRDRFFWLLVATAMGWAVILWLLLV
jgi:hypothetical protein